jgi:hypothetical protein
MEKRIDILDKGTRWFNAFILQKHTCLTCFHYQEFKRCSCREKLDISESFRDCTDWRWH